MKNITTVKDCAMEYCLSLIDDDEVVHFICEVLTKKFRPEVKVSSYLSARKVLNLIEGNAFQTEAILLDINMPEMNGWQFLQELEKINYSIPVYIISSSENAQDISRSKAYKSVKGYFVKPLTLEHINKIVEQENTARQ